MMNDASPPRGVTLLGMSPVSRGRKSKEQKRVQRSRQRPARAAVQREDTQFADLPAAGSRPGQPSSGLRALAALVDQLAGPRERPAWFSPSIGRMLRQEDAVIAAAGPRELGQAVTELTGAEVYWALNEAKRGLWFEWWFEELVRAAADRAGASLMASDLRECMSSDGVPAGLTGFRLWGFVGILVRRPGFWSSPFAGRAGEDGLAAGWFWRLPDRAACVLPSPVVARIARDRVGGSGGTAA